MKLKLGTSAFVVLLMTIISIPLVVAVVFQAGGIFGGPQVPSSVYFGQTITLSDTTTTSLTCVNQTSWIRELYTMCGIKNPNGILYWSEGPVGPVCDNPSYTCTKQWTFNESGSWTYGLSWGYINKTWDGNQWVVTQGLDASKSHMITASGAPDTTPSDLASLFNLFLAFL